MTGTAPAVPQIPAGFAPFPADFTTWVTAPFTFLSESVVFRAQLQGGQSLSAGQNLLSLDTILEDPYGGWSATTTASQPAHSWLCPAGCSGWYEVTMCAFANAESPSPANVGALLYVSGTLWQWGSAGWGETTVNAGASGGVLVPLLGGSDYIQMWEYSGVATATPTAAGRYPGMEVTWISA